MRKDLILRACPAHPLSKLVRPVFENKRVKSVIGGLVGMTSLASGIMLMPVQASERALEIGTIQAEVQLQTDERFATVVPNNTGVSQGFHLGHPGIDITAHLGTLIYPLKAGKVMKMENLKWDYGRAVYVDHGNGLVTLYAHMGKIYVQDGDMVEPNQPIGEIGVTGRTTGPHLHMEISKNGNKLNPISYLSLEKVVAEKK